MALLSVAVAAPATAQASTLISIGATGSWTYAPVNALQNWHHTHASDDPVTTTEVVEYPASLGFVGMPMGESVDLGMVALLAAIQATVGNKIIVCESQGCLSVTKLLQQFALDPDSAPAAGDLILVMVGNPGTAGGGASAQGAGQFEPFFRITFPGQTPDSPYQTVNVTREYDFFADRPTDITNALAVLNNLAAFLRVHPFYGDVDMNAPENLIKVIGNTRYVLIPTERLPMLESWYDVAETWATLTGESALLDEVKALDARLREIIDADYDRSGYVAQGSLPPNTTAEPENTKTPEPEPVPQAAQDSPDTAHDDDRPAPVDKTELDSAAEDVEESADDDVPDTLDVDDSDTDETDADETASESDDPATTPDDDDDTGDDEPSDDKDAPAARDNTSSESTSPDADA